MEKYKISVITPIYNVPLKYLKTCLISLASQTMQECEFILISDGAPQEVSYICKDFAKKDSRFKFFKRTHLGVSATRNYGLSHAQGTYITFVDSDDWIDSNMLDECYTFANKNKSDIITMDFFITQKGIDSLKKQQPKSLNPLRIIKQILLGELFGGTPLRMIRKDFLEQTQIHFPTNLGYCEDIVFLADLFLKKPKINYLNQSFYHYVQDNVDSITRNYSFETFKERQKYIHIIKDLLPSTFNPCINIAAFNIKMEAMSHKLLTISDYMTFEKTTLHTLIKSKQPWIIKFYLFINAAFFSIFHKSYKEYL